ncbi:MAG: DNA repair protein RecN [Rhodospirillales bacterium]|jgi:DNA repair protein RecN (Recombination protein N)|nr:DNA repair protein RecN [Rhodospirillales bacterium]
MLHSLSIRDVVLIERLDLSFHSGLCVLTGETGAGKSILLDALSLALGERADAGLVRHGAARAVVAAEFEVDPQHPAAQILEEQGISLDDGEPVILRRTLSADGRSRAFVNDQAVSVALLRRVGETFVEVHGQFENQRLTQTSIHRELLDAYGGLREEAEKVAAAFTAWRFAVDGRDEAAARLETARHEEEFLRHAVDELAALDPRAGEEETLAEKRSMMMHAEKIVEGMNQAAEALNRGDGVEAAFRTALRALEQIAENAEGRLDGVLAALERAAVEASEATALLEKASSEIDLDPHNLEKTEERLFAVRALARKHGCEVDALPDVRNSLSARLEAIDDGGEILKRLERQETEARDSFRAAALALGSSRKAAGAQLDQAVGVELEPLRLGKAHFVTRIDPLPEEAWGERGCDAVFFEVATNPGSAPGPLNRISSGGEMARFMLALKVVLAKADPVPTLIFDEVDANVGGAVAAAVGQRLAALAERFQVFVITHSPQVAARAAHHLRVSKADGEDGVISGVEALLPFERKEEIARMLAGARITDEARAAADSLLAGSAE